MRVLVAFFALAAGLSGQSEAEHLEAAKVRRHSGDFGGALREYAAAVKSAPADARARLLYGAALLDQSEREPNALFDALRQLRKAAELEPGNPEYAYQLGRAYQRAGEWSLDRMKSVAPESGRLYLVLGESYAGAGKTDQAIEAFQKASQRAPEMTGAHLALAFLHARAGKREMALRELEQELTLSPGSAIAKTMQQKLQQTP